MKSSTLILIIVGLVYAANVLVQASPYDEDPIEVISLLLSGWCSHDSVYNATEYCTWSGITCDPAGQITQITLSHHYCEYCEFWLLEKFNWSCFPNLVHLNLSSAGLYGDIPSHIGTLSKLTHLHLSQNYLTCQLPLSIANLSSLMVFDLSYNYLNGSIPRELGSLKNLIALNFSCNYFSGPIPSTVALFSNLTYLDMSSNQISGSIPIDLGKLKNMVSLKTRKSTPQGVIIFCVVLAFFAFYLIILFLLADKCLFKTRQVQPTKRASKNGDILSVWNYDGKIAFEDILKATEDFDIRYCIGTGGYGSVYRAQLPSGKVVALKKLHSSEAEEVSFRKSFENEVETLTKIRHKNIIRLYGFCLNKRSMFLIYEYMERGNLFCVLSDDLKAVELDWSKRIC